MKWRVKQADKDLEIEIKEAEEWLDELTEGLLPRYFWSTSEWNWIIQEKGKTRSKLKYLKKELSKD